jgi:MSHA pilin protein MshC
MNKGFTLFELIIVLLLVGILSAYAVPRLSLDTIRETGFLQQALSSIQFAQKRAITSGCTITVNISSTSCLIAFTGAPAGCPAAGNIINPGSGNTNFCDSSVAAGSPSASFSFNNIGSPSSAQSINVGSGIIIVVAETGFTYEQ